MSAASPRTSTRWPRPWRSTRSSRGRSSPTTPTSTTARATPGASTTATRRCPRSGTRSSSRRSASVSASSPRTRASRRRWATPRAHASPADFGPAARDHPGRRVRRVPLGLGDERRRRARTTTRTRTWASTGSSPSMLASGIGPNENLYAELGTTWWSLMSDPDQAAHVLGKLLKYVGTENVLWGTDSLFYGVAPGPDPGVPRVPDQRRVPGSLRLSRAHRRHQAQGPRAQRVTPPRRRPDHGALRVHAPRPRSDPPDGPHRLRDVRAAQHRRAPRLHRPRTRVRRTSDRRNRATPRPHDRRTGAQFEARCAAKKASIRFQASAAASSW